MQKLKMTNGKVAIKRDDNKKQKHGSIILHDMYQGAKNVGTIVAIGDKDLTKSGVETDHGLQVGDKVLFGKYVGAEQQVGDDTLVMMRIGDVLAVIE